jgi:hypothetical protein
MRLNSILSIKTASTALPFQKDFSLSAQAQPVQATLEKIKANINLSQWPILSSHKENLTFQPFQNLCPLLSLRLVQ